MYEFLSGFQQSALFFAKKAILYQFLALPSECFRMYGLIAASICDGQFQLVFTPGEAIRIKTDR